MELLNKLVTDFLGFAVKYSPKIIGAILVWIIGGWIIKIVVKVLRKALEKSQIDQSLKPFLLSLATITLRTLLAISVLGMIGVQMTSFIAVLGAAGLAVGMALSGTLQNFAGGVILLIFKPIRVGDVINAQGHTGKVKTIQVFVTVLLTAENKTVIIPNGPLANGNIINYTTEGIIRVDLEVGISYESSILEAKNTLIEVMSKHPKVLKNPAPFVGVSSLGDSSVNLVVRPFTKPADYWEVYFDIYEQGKIALDEKGVKIPFPQMDVHLSKQG